MLLLRKIVSLAVPCSVALIAFLHAHALGSLIDATMMPASSVAPFAEARAAASAPAAARTDRSAAPILDRNPFDHDTGSLHVRDAGDPNADALVTDPASAPPCEGVHAMITVHGDEPDASLATLDLQGKRLLRRPGSDAFDLRVVYVGEDRVWLSRDGSLCQTSVFASPPAPSPSHVGDAAPGKPGAQSALEKDIASKIQKTGPNEWQIDRGTLDRLLEAQAELMRTPLVPEKEGDSVVGFRLTKVRPGSVLATLGLENGDRLASVNGIDVTSTERMLEAYARLKTGTVDRLTLHVVRGGKPTNLDYQIR